MLQAVFSGFGGLDITDDGISQVESNIPEHWKLLKMTGIGLDNVDFEVKPR